MTILYNAFGRHRWITVMETGQERILLLDDGEEGGMSLESEAPLFDYLWFHKCSVLSDRPVRHALVLGAGAFTIPKALAIDYPEADIETVDVEAELENVARLFFRLDSVKYTRVRFHGVTAEVVLSQALDVHDFIFDDLFDDFHHVPENAASREHFLSLRRVLISGGVCVKNMIWDNHAGETRAACADTVETFRSVFPNHGVLAVGESPHGHNMLLIGLKGSTAFDWEQVRRRLGQAGVPDAVLQRTYPVSAPGNT